jgi:acetoin utilization deacetylase AcuC-like enzyme
MELRRLVVYDLREHATWQAAHAACRGAEDAVSSSAKTARNAASLSAGP